MSSHKTLRTGSATWYYVNVAITTVVLPSSLKEWL